MERFALLLAAALLLPGCASMIDGNKYPIQIDSEPRGAAYTIADQHGKVFSHGTTPDMVTLTSNDGAFDGEKYTFKFSQEGYEDQIVVLDSGMNGWMWGNLLLGGIIGSTIDLSTGAAFDLPKDAKATLRPSAVAFSPTQVTPIASSAPARKSKAERQAELMQQSLPYQEYMDKMHVIEAEPD